eukprot:m.165998 g.165998  ORF g.165998 m.165998 type:complete len:405 (-) comp12634_c0_seq1:206-1420(-)
MVYPIKCAVAMLAVLCTVSHTHAALALFEEQLSTSGTSGICRVTLRDTTTAGPGTSGLFRTIRGITQEECASRCLAQSDCTLIEYNFAGTGTCELHTESYAFTTTVDGINAKCWTRTLLGGQFTERLSSSSDSGICRLGYGNGGVSGVDYINKRNGQGITSLAACATECLNTPDCNFVEYHENSANGRNICEIHYGVFSYTVASSTRTTTRHCLTRNSALDFFTKQLITPRSASSGVCRAPDGVEGPKRGTRRGIPSVVDCAELCLADDQCTHIEYIPDYNGGNCELHLEEFGEAISTSLFEDAMCLTRDALSSSALLHQASVGTSNTSALVATVTMFAVLAIIVVMAVVKRRAAQAQRKTVIDNSIAVGTITPNPVFDDDSMDRSEIEVAGTECTTLSQVAAI